MLKNRVQRKRLDSRIEIYSETVTTGEDFSPSTSRTLVATVACAVEYNSRKQVERIVGGRETSIQQITFRIRAPRTYTITKSSIIKIVSKDGLYDIISIMKDVGRNQYWDIVAELKD